MSILLHTSSMEVQSRSDGTPTGQGSWTDQTPSVEETAQSENYNSNRTVTTSHSEVNHGDHAIDYQDYPRDIRQHFTTDELFPQYQAEYQQSTDYASMIMEGALYRTDNETTSQPIYNTGRSQPYTRQDCFNHASISPTRHNTTEQNIQYYQQSLPISPPSTPANSAIRPVLSPASEHRASPRAGSQMEQWSRTQSPEERLRIGRHRWESEDERVQNLEEHTSSRQLEWKLQD